MEKTLQFSDWIFNIKIKNSKSKNKPIICLSFLCSNYKTDFSFLNNLNNPIYIIDSCQKIFFYKKNKCEFDLIFLTHLVNEIIHYFQLKDFNIFCEKLNCIIGILLNILNQSIIKKMYFIDPILAIDYTKENTICNWTKNLNFDFKKLNFFKKEIKLIIKNFHQPGLHNIFKWNLKQNKNTILIFNYNSLNIDENELFNKWYQIIPFGIFFFNDLKYAKIISLKKLMKLIVNYFVKKN